MDEKRSPQETAGSAHKIKTLGFGTSRRRFLSVAAATGAAATLGGTALAKEGTATVTFDDQKTSGKTVTVKSVTMPKGGFVAIHDSSLNNGEVLKSVIGVSDYLDAGTHTDVGVKLFDVDGQDFSDGMKLKNDQSLIAMPHLDTNGNENYDFVSSGGKADGPYTSDKKPVVDSAQISISDQPMASVTFGDQTSNGKTLMVDSVTMSDGGFVAIHDASLNDGKVLKSVIGVSDYLDAGTHENVSVTLFNVDGRNFSDGMMLKNDQSLIAMPHLDTNGNENYDFVSSGGKADGPYTKDKKPVVDSAQITVKSCHKMTDMAKVWFDNQRSDGTSVVVKKAELSDGGFVAIHDSSLLDGKVFDSVIGVSDKLDAGTHECISVDLYDGVPGGNYDMDKLDSDTTLIAMPHYDSNDNGTYDFLTSKGDADGPYTKNKKPVVDKAKITLYDC